MCANREGSGEMRRLAWDFAGRLCDKYHNLMSWLIKVSKSYYVCHWCRHLTLFKSPFRRKRIITCKHKCSIMFNITETSSQVEEYCMLFADPFHCIAPRNKILNTCVISEFITKHEIKIILKSGWIDSGNMEEGESVAKRLQSHFFT